MNDWAVERINDHLLEAALIHFHQSLIFANQRQKTLELVEVDFLQINLELVSISLVYHDLYVVFEVFVLRLEAANISKHDSLSDEVIPDVVNHVPVICEVFFEIFMLER